MVARKFIANTAERVTPDIYRIVRNGRIVGFAFKMANGRWAPFRDEKNRIGRRTFRYPREIAKNFEELENGPQVKVRKIKPYTKKWEKMANEVARSFCPEIIPCRSCNHPVIKGYVCSTCGDSSPASD